MYTNPIVIKLLKAPKPGPHAQKFGFKLMNSMPLEIQEILECQTELCYC